MPELWWVSSLENSCADVEAEFQDIHSEETKIDIISEALFFFSITGEEQEVDYLYNSLL